MERNPDETTAILLDGVRLRVKIESMAKGNLKAEFSFEGMVPLIENLEAGHIEEYMSKVDMVRAALESRGLLVASENGTE